jgi:hypothetical protein
MLLLLPLPLRQRGLQASCQEGRVVGARQVLEPDVKQCSGGPRRWQGSLEEISKDRGI